MKNNWKNVTTSILLGVLFLLLALGSSDNEDSETVEKDVNQKRETTEENVNIEGTYYWVGEDNSGVIGYQDPSIKFTIFGDRFTGKTKAPDGDIEYKNGEIKFNSNKEIYELRSDKYYQLIGFVRITSRGPILEAYDWMGNIRTIKKK